MAIKKIRVTNFKSFKDSQEVELGKFNVLIGANASGKSNFVQFFQFIRDIINHGLDNALSMQGGIEYLRNISIGADENFSLKLISDQKFNLVVGRRRTKESLIGMKTYETTYEFALKFKKRGVGFEIAEDKLTRKCNFIKLEEQKKGIEEKEKLGEGEIVISRFDGEVKIDLHKPEGIPIKEEDIFSPFFRKRNLPPNTLLIQEGMSFFLSRKEVFGDISIYDFDPKLPKKATPIIGKAELEENGSNLSIVLKSILEHKEKKRKLFNLVKDLLPFIKDLDIEKFADKSLLFTLREIYFEKKVPASLISDGTINITALIIALYFEEKLLTIIEEPERNIHPYLISKVIEMMKDASQNKQIIVTTHNPEVVKYAGLENILLISRDKEGFSTIIRPADKEEVKTFLKNEIGVEELYVQNLLEI